MATKECGFLFSDMNSIFHDGHPILLKMKQL